MGTAAVKVPLRVIAIDPVDEKRPAPILGPMKFVKFKAAQKYVDCQANALKADERRHFNVEFIWQDGAKVNLQIHAVNPTDSYFLQEPNLEDALRQRLLDTLHSVSDGSTRQKRSERAETIQAVRRMLECYEIA